MNAFQFFGAIQIGLIYSLVAIGVFITFRILDFPDLTIDGSFPLGAAIIAILTVMGMDPWLASLCAFGGGCCAGLVTAYLNVRWKILHLLASILTMMALYSINLRIMGRPNLSIPKGFNIFLPFEDYIGIPYFGAPLYGVVVLASIVVLVVSFLVWRFLISEVGLAMRATGSNPRMAKAQGIKTGAMVVLGVSLSNGLVALSGALFAQSNDFADVGFGPGTIVVALASVVIGEVLIPARKIWLMILGCILGAIIYRILYALALNSSTLGLQASDMNLMGAILVGVAMIMPQIKTHIRNSLSGNKRHD